MLWRELTPELVKKQLGLRRVQQERVPALEPVQQPLGLMLELGRGLEQQLLGLQLEQEQQLPGLQLGQEQRLEQPLLRRVPWRQPDLLKETTPGMAWLI